MSFILPDPRPQPLQLWQGVLCRLAKLFDRRTAKVRGQIAKFPLHGRAGGCAGVQRNLGESVMVVLQIGKTGSVSSMSVFGGLLKECHRGVSSSQSPCLPAMEDNR
jgi:hypothetical protein